MEQHEQVILNVTDLSVTRGGNRLLDGISFTLDKKDHLAITGHSGSGKTQLGLALAGRVHANGVTWTPGIPAGRIAWVEQQHHFRNLSNTTGFYYQQRFNSADAADTQTVEDYLSAGAAVIAEVLGEIDISSLYPKPLVQLSNGENKKVQLAKALLARPAVLVLDQPFTGLDTATRRHLHDLIDASAANGIRIILVTGGDELPGCITKVITLERGTLAAVESRTDFLERWRLRHDSVPRHRIDEAHLVQLAGRHDTGFENAILMKDVHIRYGEKNILAGINWQVKRGERWLLSGPNGAGKSTLLSLVTGDNPQAYANEIYLFDRRRGSGETIWDIKKRIGYLSPELHLYFDQGSTAFEVIASGLFDTIGLFRQVAEEDIHRIGEWMELVGVKHLLRKRLAELPLGQQRMMLLLRALVKNPPLLILDEPYQGLDDEQQEELSELIDVICISGGKTMIFVTHEANRRPGCIDRFIYLEEGKTRN